MSARAVARPLLPSRLHDGIWFGEAGRFLLRVIAIGLFAYGVFCVAEAKYRKAA